MSIAFVDTGAWIALMTPRDTYHGRAREFFRSVAGRERFVTSNYVLAETVTWLAYHHMRYAALQFMEMVDASELTRRLQVQWVTKQVHSEARVIFQDWDDQDFSLCDCASIAICRSSKVDYVFGFDHHFSAAGFELRPG